MNLIPEVLYEDNHLIAINKPGGLLVQGDSTGDPAAPDLVKAYIARKYAKPGNVYLGVIHRLDRPVSGVLLMGRTSKATARMNAAFREQQVVKTYWAIVQGEPPDQAGRLDGYLVKNRKLNKSYIHADSRKGKYSSLEYRWLGSSDHYHLLQVTPQTGRHHQIRLLLSHMGCPIRGDLKYGAARSCKDGNICLHARSLAFIHPVGKQKMHITADPPEQPIWQAFKEAAL